MIDINIVAVVRVFVNCFGNIVSNVAYTTMPNKSHSIFRFLFMILKRFCKDSTALLSLNTIWFTVKYKLIPISVLSYSLVYCILVYSLSLLTNRLYRSLVRTPLCLFQKKSLKKNHTQFFHLGLNCLILPYQCFNHRAPILSLYTDSAAFCLQKAV